jgi:antagonist of KipI
MDQVAHRVANALVGNQPGLATLEVTMTGPHLAFEDQRVVAVAGAEFALAVDGKPQLAGTPFLVRAGGQLRVGPRLRGARAYLAVNGGFDVPLTMGSRSTHVASQIGGFKGRALAAGDRVLLGPPGQSALRLLDSNGKGARPAASLLRRHFESPARVRVLAGPQADRFADDALDALQSAAYTLALDSNRMGFRLRGPVLRHRRGADIISDATPVGALQVPGSGLPVLLMVDRQTTGGYPKIATAITADLGVAGQLAPGDAVMFQECSRRDAVAALIAQERVLMAIERSSAP